MARKPKVLDDLTQTPPAPVETPKSPKEDKPRAVSKHGKELGRKAAPKDESKEDTFRRLANARLNGTLKENDKGVMVRQGGLLNAIRLLGNLSNRAQYGYTDAQVDHIFRILHEELDKTEKLFRSGSQKIRTIDL